MFFIGLFFGLILGIELQTWWHNKGAKKYIEQQIKKWEKNND